MLKVVDVADLGGNCDSLFVLGSNLSVVDEGLEGALTNAGVHEIAADHDPGSPLASLAMNSHHIVLSFGKKLGHVLAEVVHENKGWRVMIVELEDMAYFEKVRWVIRSL